MNAPILLIGANGQVGREALPLLGSLGSVVGVRRADLDLTDPQSIRNMVRAVMPRWIVNAAAYTAVDKAEGDSLTAFAVNGAAPGILGEEAARIGAPVIHFSTDYVFSGAGDQPWREDDRKGPLSVYGASKLAGERALAESGAAHVIFRTSWVFSSQGENFLLRILKLAQEREELRVVDDQHGAPTAAQTLAELVAFTVGKAEAGAERSGMGLDDAVRPFQGTYHACSAGSTTWFGFASEFMRLAQLARPERGFAKLTPIPSSEYPTPAARPSNSRMSCEKLTGELGFAMPRWEDATARVMDELVAEGRI
ncbi:MAG: dTDP-4-dehydrorhamnose reductase [Acidobacteriaceae bacterium]